MFTLGNKEAIVNGLDKYAVKAYQADGTEVTTYNMFLPDGTTPSGLVIDHINIDGFGSFRASQILSNSITIGTAAVLGSAKLTCPSATQIGLASGDINIPVTVLIRINTSRYSSEFATDFIRRGRPLVINIMLSGSDAAADVATKIDAAFSAYESAFATAEFKNGSLPFNWTRTSSVLGLELKEASLSFDPSVTFLKKWDTFGLVWSGASKWEAGATSSFSGVEPVDGKYLEENVAMATMTNQDIYGINTGNVPVDMNALYTQVKWEAKATTTAGVDGNWAPHAKLSTESADAELGQRSVSFSLYYYQDIFGSILTAPAEDATLDSLQKLAMFLHGSLPVV